MNKAFAISCIATLLVGGGIAVVSCSSSSDSGPSGITDSGNQNVDTGTKTDSGVVTDTGTTNTDTGTPPDDTGTSEGGSPDCGSDPTLHPTEAGVGPFCPGFHADGGTATSPCPAGQFCCEEKTGTPSTCAATASGCAATAEEVYQCDGPSMCSGATPVCCSDAKPAPRAGCTYEDIFPAKGTTTVCAASCSSTQITICEADTDCTAPAKCTPIKVAGKQIGYCK